MLLRRPLTNSRLEQSAFAKFISAAHVDAGSKAHIRIDDSQLTGRKTLVLDLAKNHETITTAPAEFTAAKLTLGCRVVSVRDTFSEGVTLAFDPVRAVALGISAALGATNSALNAEPVRLFQTRKLNLEFTRELTVASARD